MCVLNETQCHSYSEHLLDTALQQILSQQDVWHIVQQFPDVNEAEVRSRILDENAAAYFCLTKNTCLAATRYLFADSICIYIYIHI